MSDSIYDSCIELANNAVLDVLTDTVVLQLDRIHISMSIDEFFEFYDSVSEIRADLLSAPGYIVGKYMDGEKERTTLVREPESEDEYM